MPPNPMPLVRMLGLVQRWSRSVSEIDFVEPRYRTDHLDQALPLPPSLHDWLPEEHLARFIADVIEELDLGSRVDLRVI